MTNDADDGDEDGDDNDNDDYDNDDDDYGDDDDDNDDDEEHGDVGQIAKPIVCTRAALPPVNLSITALQMMDRPLQNTKETKIQLRTGRCRTLGSPQELKDFPSSATLYKYKEL